MNTYVITDCWYDSLENSFDRFVIKVLINVDESSLKEYQCYGYEIYIVNADGTVEIIQQYNDYPDPEAEDYDD